MSIRLHIGRLVVDGLPIAQRDAPLLRRALEHELTRSLAADPALRGRLTGGTLAEVSAAPLHVAAVATAAEIGTAIGRSLSDAIRGGEPQ